MVAAAIREILGVYRDVVVFRRMKSDLKDIEGAQKEKAATITALQNFYLTKVDGGIAKATDRLCDKFNKVNIKERENEPCLSGYHPHPQHLGCHLHAV